MRLIFLGLFLVLSSQGFTQANSAEPLTLSLEEAKSIAFDNNLKLSDQKLDVEIAKSQVDQTLAAGLPQINGNFDYQWNVINAFAQRTDTGTEGPIELPQIDLSNYAGIDANSFLPNQTSLSQAIAFESVGGFFAGLGDAFVARHQATAGVIVNQQLFDGVYLLGLEATKVYVELSEVQLAPTKRDIEKAVEKAYYGGLITKENIEIIDKNIENLNSLIFETKEVYKAGFAEQLDIDRLELSLSILKNSKKNLQKIEDFNFDILKNAMSLPLDTQLTLVDEIDTYEKYVKSQEVIVDMANPELWPEFKIFEVQEKIQGLDIERIERGKLPTVDAFFNGNYNYQGNDFIFTNGLDNWFPNVTVGLGVAVPIFDGNLRKNQIKQKQIELEKIKVAKESLQQNIDISIENAITNFTTNRQDLFSQVENIALAQKIYNTTQIKYKEGVGSSLELYQAQQDLYTTQQNYINALYNLLIAKVDVEQALGK